MNQLTTGYLLYWFADQWFDGQDRWWDIDQCDSNPEVLLSFCRVNTEGLNFGNECRVCYKVKGLMNLSLNQINREYMLKIDQVNGFKAINKISRDKIVHQSIHQIEYIMANSMEKWIPRFRVFDRFVIESTRVGNIIIPSQDDQQEVFTTRGLMGSLIVNVTIFFNLGKIDTSNVDLIWQVIWNLYKYDGIQACLIVRMLIESLSDYIVYDHEIGLFFSRLPKNIKFITLREINQLMHSLNGNIDREINEILSNVEILGADGRYVEGYQRKEWLGDAILKSTVAEYLYKNYDNDESELSSMTTCLLRNENLAKFMIRYLEMSNINLSKKMKITPSTLADLFEYLVAELYLGDKDHKEFILRYIKETDMKLDDLMTANFLNWYRTVHRREFCYEVKTEQLRGANLNTITATWNGKTVKGTFGSKRSGIVELTNSFFDETLEKPLESGGAIGELLTRKDIRLPEVSEEIGSKDYPFKVTGLGKYGIGRTIRGAQEDWSVKVLSSDIYDTLEDRHYELFNSGNCKNDLQTLCIRKLGSMPVYETSGSGNGFTSICTVKQMRTESCSTSKKKAESQAAEIMIKLVLNM
jgi:dsRNA-specific ribonuclease